MSGVERMTASGPEAERAVTAARRRSLSLKVNLSWTVLGKGVDAATKAGLLIVLAKLGSPELVGQFALGLAIVAPVLLFGNMQLSAVQATDRIAEFSIRDYMGLRMLTVVCAVMFTAGIALLSGLERQTVAVVCAVAFVKGAEAFGEVFHGFFYQQEHMDRAAQSLMSKGVVALAAVWVGLSLTDALVIPLLVAAALNVGIVLAFDVPWTRTILRSTTGTGSALTPRLNIRRLYPIAVVALPLGFVSLFDSLSANVPRYFLQNALGESGVGYFSAVAYIMITGGMVMTAVSFSIRPRLAHYFLEDVTAFRYLYRNVIIIGLVAGFAGLTLALVAGAPVLRVLYTVDYAAYAPVLSWLMVGGLFWYVATAVAVAVTAARQFRVQAPILFFTLAVTTVAAAVLIPRYYLVGAAWAVSLGMLARLLMFTVVYWKRVRPHLQPARDSAQEL